MAKLRRLYLHENKLEVFRNDTFAGLEALEYLQVCIIYPRLTRLTKNRVVNGEPVPRAAPFVTSLFI